MKEALADARREHPHAGRQKAIMDAKPGKGKGKGKGANSLNFPAGAKAKSGNGRNICAKWNRGSCTFGDGCRFAHICYFCEKPEHAGKDHA